MWLAIMFVWHCIAIAIFTIVIYAVAQKRHRDSMPAIGTKGSLVPNGDQMAHLLNDGISSVDETDDTLSI